MYYPATNAYHLFESVEEAKEHFPEMDSSYFSLEYPETLPNGSVGYYYGKVEGTQVFISEK